MKEYLFEILWTNTAESSFQDIIEYLQEEWSEKEVRNFLKRVDKFIITLSKYPTMCRSSSKRKNVRIGILDKHTQTVYQYIPENNSITILLFRGMKRSPSSFKY